MVFALTPRDAQVSNTIVTNTLLLFTEFDSILFDLGATHSFVSKSMPNFVIKYQNS
jgi:hypothetical protein